jgi:hypothetical protein
MARIITTTQADKEGLIIKEPLTIIATTRGPYLDSGDNIIAAPPELGADPEVKERELDRWAAQRGYVRGPKEAIYRPKNPGP